MISLEGPFIANRLRECAVAAQEEKARVESFTQIDEAGFREVYAGRIEALTETQRRFNEVASQVQEMINDYSKTPDDIQRVLEKLKEEFVSAG